MQHYPTRFSHSSCYISLKVTVTFFILLFRFLRFQMRHCTIYNIFLTLDEYTVHGTRAAYLRYNLTNSGLVTVKVRFMPVFVSGTATINSECSSLISSIDILVSSSLRMAPDIPMIKMTKKRADYTAN
jgi:hypothetical protein